MGARLYDREAVFRATLDRCCTLVKGWDPKMDIIEELHKKKDESEVYSAPVALVLIPAVQISLVDLIRSKGVEPAGMKVLNLCSVKVLDQFLCLV